MEYSATISPCGSYRYLLGRTWDWSRSPLILGMLNPSTADDTNDDPTVRRAIGFAKREGCGSLRVWNIGAGRATNPKEWLAMADPIGPDNYSEVGRLFYSGKSNGARFVVAWGANAPHGFVSPYLSMARDLNVPLECFGRTKSGAPKHPLYLPKDAPLVPFYG